MSQERTAAPVYASAEDESKAFIWKVYGYMAFALGLTGAISLWLMSRPDLVIKWFYDINFSTRRVNPSALWYILCLAELGLVFIFAASIKKVKSSTALLMLLIYAVSNGFTLAPILLLYTKSSVASTFFITGGMFASFSAFGFITKRDLSGMGALMGMMVWGLIIAMIVNMFMHSSQMQYIISIVGVIVFAGLTMADTQKIKQMNVLGNAGTDEDKKEAISGALILYLDFINMFLFLLRILGSRRN